ncbi:MAG TPA: hypothetical protein VG826_27460 [Pirellulales bacterium]|nr:hypothetical protein [Pirellulales bacterium]
MTTTNSPTNSGITNSILAAPANAVSEITSLRTANSKTWDMGNGVRTAVHSISPVHWADVDGVWQDIDTTLDETGSPSSTRYAIAISTNGIGYSDKISGDAVMVALMAIGDTPASQFNITAPAISGNRATWSEVVPGVDIYLEALPAGARFHAIIKSPSAPTSFTVQYTQPATLTSTIVDTTADGKDAAGLTCQVTETASEPTTNSEGQIVTSVTYSFGGNVKVRDPNTRVASWQPTPTYPVDIDPTVTANIATDNDDGFEKEPYSQWYPSANYWGIGYSFSGAYGPYNPGLRFALSVPQGATVSSATLSFYYKSAYGTGTQNAKLYAAAVDNAAAWSNSNRPSTQTKSTHSASLSLPHTSGTLTNATVDCTSIVQEQVSRGGWVSGNYIALFALPTNKPNDPFLGDDYHRHNSKAAMLTVTYTGGAGGGPFPWFNNGLNGGPLGSMLGGMRG